MVDRNVYLVVPSLSTSSEIATENCEFSQYLGTKLDMLFEIAKTVEIVIILGKTAILPQILDFIRIKTLLFYYICVTTGKYTCNQYNGSSVADYIIAKPNISNKINYFQVLPLTTYSDHCQIVANLDIKPKNPTNTGGKSFTKAPGQFKWDSNSKQKVNSYLRSHDFKSY